MTLQTRLNALAQAVGADIKTLNGKVLSGGQIQLDPWHVVGSAGEPAFAPGWQNLPGFATVAFRKAPDGQVYLRGNPQATVAQSSSVPIFTLPVGYRPPAQIISPSGGTNPRYDVRSTGEVLSVAALVQNGWLSLEGNFDTESVLQTASVAAQPMEPWHLVGTAGEPAYASPWQNYPVAVFGSPGFRKYPDGRVRLRGLVNNTAAVSSGTIPFVLPAGYRPPQQELFTVQTGAGLGRIDITTAGAVTLVGALAINSWVSLDGLEFDTELVSSYATGMLSAPPLVTSLPGPPLVDGQECYFATSNAITNAIWHLRYVASLGDAYKWQVIGGGPIISPIEATVATVSAGAVVASPTLTLPLAGFYELYVQSEITSSVAAAALYVHPAAGGVNLAGTWGGTTQSVASTYPTAYDRFITPAALAAGTVIQIWANGVATATVRGRRIWATPIRVG